MKLYDKPEVYDIAYSEKFNEKLKEFYSYVFQNKEIQTILDCSVGSGNLSLALAELGYNLYGSDINVSMLEKAKGKFSERGIEVELKQCDFRNLSEKYSGAFDCVMSTGNSLAHVNNNDVKKTINEMSKLIKSKGYLYLDIRNWDNILKTKERFYLYNPMFKEDTRVNLVQVWDYNEDGTMTFNFLYTFEKENKIIRKETFEERYYPILKDELLSYIKENGFTNIQIINFGFPEVRDFEDMEWYCILAQKL